MSRTRRGFTMVELLVALVLLGLVSAALYRVLVNNQRLYFAQTQRIDLSQNIRAATNILPAEFRELDAFDQDIIAMSSDSIQIRAMRWLSFVCKAPVLAGVNAGIQMTIRGGTVPSGPVTSGLPRHSFDESSTGRLTSSAQFRLVEVEEQLVRGDHDLGVLPLGGAVVAGDQAHTVQPAEVAEHEGIAGLGLIGRTVGEREVP